MNCPTVIRRRGVLFRRFGETYCLHIKGDYCIRYMLQWPEKQIQNNINGRDGLSLSGQWEHINSNLELPNNSPQERRQQQATRRTANVCVLTKRATAWRCGWYVRTAAVSMWPANWIKVFSNFPQPSRYPQLPTVTLLPSTHKSSRSVAFFSPVGTHSYQQSHSCPPHTNQAVP